MAGAYNEAMASLQAVRSCSVAATTSVNEGLSIAQLPTRKKSVQVVGHIHYTVLQTMTRINYSLHQKMSLFW